MPVVLRRFLRITSAIALAAAISVSATGCKKKTPEERFTEAIQLVQQQQQTALGVLKLQELIREFPEDPVSVQARFYLAELYMGLGRQENMERAFEQLKAVYEKIGLNQRDGANAHLFATQVLARIGNLERAEKHAREGVEKATDPAIKTEMGFLLSSLLLAQTENPELYSEAEAFFRETSLNNPDPTMRGQAREILADFLRRNERYADSNAVYTAYLEKYPDDEIRPQLLLAMALNHRLAGEEEQFEALFAEGAAGMKDYIEKELDSESRLRLRMDASRLFEVAGKLEDSEEQLRKVMAENVGKMPAIQAQIAIGELRIRTNQLEKAREIFQQIERENPGSRIGQTAQQYLAAIDRIEAEGEGGVAVEIDPNAVSPAAVEASDDEGEAATP
jgi:TolA-binding protein